MDNQPNLGIYALVRQAREITSHPLAICQSGDNTTVSLMLENMTNETGKVFFVWQVQKTQVQVAKIVMLSPMGGYFDVFDVGGIARILATFPNLCASVYTYQTHLFSFLIDTGDNFLDRHERIAVDAWETGQETKLMYGEEDQEEEIGTTSWIFTAEEDHFSALEISDTSAFDDFIDDMTINLGEDDESDT